MPRMILLLLGAALALLVACGGDSKDESATVATLTPEASACGPDRAHAAGEFDETITSGGVERSYILHVPTGYDGSKATPVVVLIAGLALESRVMLDYSAMGAVADREGFIVVSIEGTGELLTWNYANVPGGADDVSYVRDLLTKLGAELCTDPSRTFATGFSSGSAMAERLACDMPEAIVAVGLVEQLYDGCSPLTPVIVFHEAIDQVVPFAGGGENIPEEGGGSFPSVRETVAAWAASFECEANGTITKPGTHVELTTFNGCGIGDGAVQLYVVEDGGHAWPGADQFGDPAVTTQEIDASELIWQFFAGVD